MSILLTRTSVIDLQSIIVTGVAAALSAPVERTIITTGEIAWDSNCAQLGVTTVLKYRSRSFPAVTSVRVQCGDALTVVSMGLEVVRCSPIVDEDGNMPDPAALESAAAQVLDDAFVMETTVECILNSQYRASPQQLADWMISDHPMIGPLGAEVGSRLNFLAAWITPCGC